MKIIDTDTVDRVLKMNIALGDQYFVTPDVKEEISVSEIVNGKQAPKEIREVFSQADFDESIYLKNYYWALNHYPKRSFFNMKGFGDVSVAALVKTLIETNQEKPPTLFPGMEEKIEIFTGDQNLKKFLEKEFGKDIIVHPKTDI